MPTLIQKPTRIQAAGNKPKLIDEYIGRVNSKTSTASVAHMRSPEGWLEPGQTPEFDEFTIVLKGTLQVEHKGAERSMSTRDRPLWHTPGSGYAIPLPTRRGQSISRCACPHSRWRAYIGTSEEIQRGRAGLHLFEESKLGGALF